MEPQPDLTERQIIEAAVLRHERIDRFLTLLLRKLLTGCAIGAALSFLGFIGLALLFLVLALLGH